MVRYLLTVLVVLSYSMGGEQTSFIQGPVLFLPYLLSPIPEDKTSFPLSRPLLPFRLVHALVTSFASGIISYISLFETNTKAYLTGYRKVP